MVLSPKGFLQPPPFRSPVIVVLYPLAFGIVSSRCSPYGRHVYYCGHGSFTIRNVLSSTQRAIIVSFMSYDLLMSNIGSGMDRCWLESSWIWYYMEYVPWPPRTMTKLTLVPRFYYLRYLGESYSGYSALMTIRFATDFFVLPALQEVWYFSTLVIELTLDFKQWRTLDQVFGELSSEHSRIIPTQRTIRCSISLLLRRRIRG